MVKNKMSRFFVVHCII